RMGSSRSRCIQANGVRHESCQPAASASAASPPYQMPASVTIAMTGSKPSAPAAQLPATSGGMLPASSSGRKYQPNVTRRSRAQRRPRPADLAAPPRGGATPPQRLREWRLDQAHPQAGAAHHLGGGRILGRLGSKRPHPAGAIKIATAPQHGLALGEAEPDPV